MKLARRLISAFIAITMIAGCWGGGQTTKNRGSTISNFVEI